VCGNLANKPICYRDLLDFAQHCHEALVINVFLQLTQLGQFGDEFVTNFL